MCRIRWSTDDSHAPPRLRITSEVPAAALNASAARRSSGCNIRPQQLRAVNAMRDYRTEYTKLLDALASELSALASLCASVRAEVAGPHRDLIRATLDDLSRSLLESSSLITERAEDSTAQRSRGSHPHRAFSPIEACDASIAMKTILRAVHAMWLKVHRVRATSALAAAHNERLRRVAVALLEQTSLVGVAAAQIAKPPAPREGLTNTEMELR